MSTPSSAELLQLPTCIVFSCSAGRSFCAVSFRVYPSLLPSSPVASRRDVLGRQGLSCLFLSHTACGWQINKSLATKYADTAAR